MRIDFVSVNVVAVELSEIWTSQLPVYRHRFKYMLRTKNWFISKTCTEGSGPPNSPAIDGVFEINPERTRLDKSYSKNNKNNFKVSRNS